MAFVEELYFVRCRFSERTLPSSRYDNSRKTAMRNAARASMWRGRLFREVEGSRAS